MATTKTIKRKSAPKTPKMTATPASKKTLKKVKIVDVKKVPVKTKAATKAAKAKKTISNEKSNSETPLISIITPVFNAEKFVAETIQSVQAQTYKNWELILVDDKSSDDSVRIIEHFIEKDSRIKLVKNIKKQGIIKSRNKGINMAKGDYLRFVNADILWHHDKLITQLNYMERKNCPLTFCGHELVDGCINNTKQKKYRNIPSSITYRRAIAESKIWDSTVMFNLSRINKTIIKKYFNAGSIKMKHKERVPVVEDYLVFYRHVPKSIHISYLLHFLIPKCNRRYSL